MKCLLNILFSSERTNKHCAEAIVVERGAFFLRSFFKNATKNGGNERSLTALNALLEVSLDVFVSYKYNFGDELTIDTRR